MSDKPKRDPAAPAPCKSCGAPMLWAAVVKRDGSPGKMPFDPDPSEAGTHALFKRPDGSLRAEWVRPADRAAHGGAGPRLRTSHFATCPNADEHRRGGR